MNARHSILRRCLLPLAALAVLLITDRSPAEQPPEMAVFSGPVMGTGFTVKIVGLPESVDPEIVRQNVERELVQVDALMSTYRDDSELSRFNAYEDTDWFAISPETAGVVAEAIRIGRLTGGAFDVTIGPVVNLWQFGPDSRRPDRVPAPEEIDRTLERTGLDKLEVRLDPPAVRKKQPDLYLDLSGIAKGYAVDRVAECLETHGIDNYFVDVGGELRVRGTNQRGTPWRIGIETPTPGRRGIQTVLPLGEVAMATSGDYRNYFEADGVRYSHLIDPRTGRPIAHRLASATVLDDSCMRADALATALMVLGPDAGYELAAREGLPVLLLVKTETGFEERATSTLPAPAPADPAPAASAKGPSPDEKTEAMPGALFATVLVFLLFVASLALGVLRGKRHMCSCKQSAQVMHELEGRSCGACGEQGELVKIQPSEKAADEGPAK